MKAMQALNIVDCLLEPHTISFLMKSKIIYVALSLPRFTWKSVLSCFTHHGGYDEDDDDNDDDDDDDD